MATSVVTATESKYESVWQRAAQQIAVAPDAGLDAVCAELRRVWCQGAAAYLDGRRFRFHYASAGATRGADGRPRERLVVRDGRYCLVPNDKPPTDWTANYLMQYWGSRGPFDMIVELGSGAGRNLFELAHAIRASGATLPKLCAAEYTQAGRELTRHLRDAAGLAELSVRPFDLNAPNLSFLPESGAVLVFTAHAIEQIPRLEPALFLGLAEYRGPCHGLHFEPVGWQTTRATRNPRHARKMASTIWRAVRTRLRSGGFRDVEVRRGELTNTELVRANAAAWAARGGYNQNLVTLLAELATAGVLDLESIEPDRFGVNPFNPTTVLTWRNRPPEGRGPLETPRTRGVRQAC